MDDRRAVVVQVLSNGRIKINSEDVERQNLGTRLEQIFRIRVYRVVFVAGDPGLPFSEIIQVIDVAAKPLDYVALLAPSVLNQVHGGSGICFDPNVPRSYRPGKS